MVEQLSWVMSICRAEVASGIATYHRNSIPLNPRTGSTFAIKPFHFAHTTIRSQLCRPLNRWFIFRKYQNYFQHTETTILNDYFHFLKTDVKAKMEPKLSGKKDFITALVLGERCQN